MTEDTRQTFVHTYCDDALGKHDATELASVLRRGDCSRQELIEASLERAQRAQPEIQGLATPIPTNSSLLNAGQGRPRHDELNGFSGVPTVIKDNTDVDGFPTGHGTAAIHARTSTRTSAFAQQMLETGLACIGKSTLPEFGFNATTEPAHGRPTRNPWNTAFSSGASSGGSAALVAAGVVPIAHANDGGGSIRIPAACCGLVGLKPSRGRLIDNEAAKALPINIVADGVLTRSVRDTANFYAEAERYYKNPKLPAIGRVERTTDTPMKIGVVLESLSGHPIDADTRRAVEATAKSLGDQGHHIESIPIPVPESFPADFALYWGMLAFGMRTNGKRLAGAGFDRNKVDGLTRGLDRMFKKQFYRLPGTLWRLRRSCQDYARAIAGFDAVLTPVLGHTTPEIGYLSPNVTFDELFDRLARYACFTPLANASGAPAIAIPGGITTDNLPIGVQLMGHHGGEKTLLELAFAMEQTRPWRLVPG